MGKVWEFNSQFFGKSLGISFSIWGNLITIFGKSMGNSIPDFGKAWEIQFPILGKYGKFNSRFWESMGIQFPVLGKVWECNSRFWEKFGNVNSRLIPDTWVLLHVPRFGKRLGIPNFFPISEIEFFFLCLWSRSLFNN